MHSSINGAVRAVVVDASAINQLDSSAEKALRDLFEGYLERNIEFVLAGPIGPVRDVLDRSGLLADLGERGVTWSVHDEMHRLQQPRQQTQSEPEPPRQPQPQPVP